MTRLISLRTMRFLQAVVVGGRAVEYKRIFTVVQVLSISATEVLVQALFKSINNRNCNKRKAVWFVISLRDFTIWIVNGALFARFFRCTPTTARRQVYTFGTARNRTTHHLRKVIFQDCINLFQNIRVVPRGNRRLWWHRWTWGWRNRLSPWVTSNSRIALVCMRELAFLLVYQPAAWLVELAATNRNPCIFRFCLQYECGAVVVSAALGLAVSQQSRTVSCITRGQTGPTVPVKDGAVDKLSAIGSTSTQRTHRRHFRRRWHQGGYAANISIVQKCPKRRICRARLSQPVQVRIPGLV